MRSSASLPTNDGPNVWLMLILMVLHTSSLGILESLFLDGAHLVLASFLDFFPLHIGCPFTGSGHRFFGCGLLVITTSVCIIIAVRLPGRVLITANLDTHGHYLQGGQG